MTKTILEILDRSEGSIGQGPLMYTENKYFLTSRWMNAIPRISFFWNNDACRMTQYSKRNFKLYFFTGSKSICGKVENYSLFLIFRKRKRIITEGEMKIYRMCI